MCALYSSVGAHACVRYVDVFSPGSGCGNLTHIYSECASVRSSSTRVAVRRDGRACARVRARAGVGDKSEPVIIPR